MSNLIKTNNKMLRRVFTCNACGDVYADRANNLCECGINPTTYTEGYIVDKEAVDAFVGARSSIKKDYLFYERAAFENKNPMYTELYIFEAKRLFCPYN